MPKTTTIRIPIETKKKLDKIGNKGETYNDVILKLMKYYEKHLGK